MPAKVPGHTVGRCQDRRIVRAQTKPCQAAGSPVRNTRTARRRKIRIRSESREFGEQFYSQFTLRMVGLQARATFRAGEWNTYMRPDH